MRLIIFAAILCTAAPAMARSSDKEKALDPNQVICRSEPVTGSRLATQRTCLTRMQWKQQQDEMRKITEHVQGAGFNVPDPS